MDVNDDDQLMCARLEEKILNVAEENIDLTAAMICVAKTILVNFYFSRNTFTVESRPDEDIIQIRGLAT